MRRLLRFLHKWLWARWFGPRVTVLGAEYFVEGQTIQVQRNEVRYEILRIKGDTLTVREVK